MTPPHVHARDDCCGVVCAVDQLIGAIRDGEGRTRDGCSVKRAAQREISGSTVRAQHTHGRPHSHAPGSREAGAGAGQGGSQARACACGEDRHQCVTWFRMFHPVVIKATLSPARYLPCVSPLASGQASPRVMPANVSHCSSLPMPPSPHSTTPHWDAPASLVRHMHADWPSPA